MLDRVLDKGLVVAGDIKVSLAEVELLTIRIRLIVCSIDKAEQIGLDWWRYDHALTRGGQNPLVENEELRAQIARLEDQVAQLTAQKVPARRQARAKLPPRNGKGSRAGDGENDAG